MTPVGLGPKSGCLVPSLSVISLGTSVQAPTSCSFRLICWAVAFPDITANPSSAAVDMLRILCGFIGVSHSKPISIEFRYVARTGLTLQASGPTFAGFPIVLGEIFRPIDARYKEIQSVD